MILVEPRTQNENIIYDLVDLTNGYVSSLSGGPNQEEVYSKNFYTYDEFIRIAEENEETLTNDPEHFLIMNRTAKLEAFLGDDI